MNDSTSAVVYRASRAMRRHGKSPLNACWNAGVVETERARATSLAVNRNRASGRAAEAPMVFSSSGQAHKRMPIPCDAVTWRVGSHRGDIA